MRSELLDGMLEGFFRNPINPREWVLLDKRGNPLAGVTLHHMNSASWGLNYLHLEEIRAMTKGGGRKAMELLIEHADLLCATIGATVEPLRAAAYKMKKLSKRRLMDWYKDLGFVQERGGGFEIVRYPDPARCKS